MRCTIRVRRGPVQPSADQVMRHDATRLPFRDWCVPCIEGKAPDWPDSRLVHSSTAVPMCQLDSFFLDRRGDTDILTVRNFLHCPSGASLVQCCDRGPPNHVVQAVATFMDFLGLKKICLRTDGEPASGAPARAVKIARNEETQLETTSRHLSSSLGAAERSNRSVERSDPMHADRSREVSGHVLWYRGQYPRLVLPTRGLAHHETSRAD